MTRIWLIGGVALACVCSFAAGLWVAGWSVVVGPRESVDWLSRQPPVVPMVVPVAWQGAPAAPGSPGAASSESASDPLPDELPQDDPRRQDPNWRLRHESLSMGEMAEQARRILSIADADLEVALGRLRDKVTGIGPRAMLARHLMEESQRCWEAYGDAQLAMEYPSPDGLRYGSIVSMSIPLRRAGMVERRVQELKTVLGDDAEEGVVGGPQWPDAED